MSEEEDFAAVESAQTDAVSKQYLLALGLYVVWIFLVYVSIWLGQISLAPGAALPLTGCVVTTNLLFWMLARSTGSARLSAQAFTAAATALGLMWAGVFFFFSTHAGELVVGMYLTLMLMAIARVGTRAFMRLSMLAVGSYLFVLIAKLSAAPVVESAWPEALRLLVLAGVLAWCQFYARHVDGLRHALHARTEELENAVAKVTHQAEIDHLTNSFNRRYIMDTLDREKGRADRAGKAFSVLIFDLDHFKSLNDQHGHLVGDKVLKGFAKRVRGELRAMDSVNQGTNGHSFGRFGGEEFIAVLPVTPLDGAFRCAERLRNAVASRAFDELYRITVSVGVAEYNRGESVQEVLARADNALYAAKEAGRNQVACDGTPPPESTGEVPTLRLIQ
jgi:diguanylate cyclase (GGDEF)-like protein